MILKAGSKVKILHSIRNWHHDGMTPYVGQILTLTHDYDTDVSGADLRFKEIPQIGSYAITSFVWRYSDGHFEPIKGSENGTEPVPNLIVSKSFRQFLETTKDDNRISRILLNALDLQYNGVGKLALRTDEANYITMRRDGMISFMPAGKEQLFNDDHTWKIEGRQAGKPVKVIRKIFTEKLSKLLKDSDFEGFANKYKAKCTGGFNFKVLPASQIGEVYDMSHGDYGSLGQSCMKGRGKYFEMLFNCPDVQIVTLTKDDGTLMGRALLWQAKNQDGNVIPFLDRFYVREDHLYELFVEEALKNGWYYKKYYKNRDDKEILINPKTQEVETHTLTVNLNTDGFSYYPYLDTFHWGDDDRIYNYDTEEQDGTYCYDQTGGDRTSYDGIWSEFHGESYPEDQLVWSDYHDSYILVSETYRVVDSYYHRSVVERL